jgi:adenine-specific DNA-methyltransferase
MIIETLQTFDHVRKSFSGETSRTARSEIGQFLTPAKIAQFMSSLFENVPQQVKILDPGAGAGVLFAMCVETLISQENHPLSIKVVAYETDGAILPHLEETMKRCQSLCTAAGIAFQGIVRTEDFVSAAITETSGSLFAGPRERFTHAILNPPYMKINSRTAMSKYLYSSNIEVANLYAVFVWLSMLLLKPGGQMVTITPRSFCHGP